MSGLTEDQQLVADSDGHTMCCALPGSGKSHTMVALADNLVKKDPSYRLLLITFTRAAAEELNERLAEKIQGSGVHRTKAATFDSVFGQQVRNGKKNSKRTLVGGEQYNFIDRTMRYAGITMEIEDALQWVDTYGRMLIPEPVSNESGIIGWQIFQAYTELLNKNNLQDFNAIARSAYLGVQTGDLAPWPATHILVDEFQDTSDIQYAWIQVHGERGAKVTVVGDDDQSIYSWRGAQGYQNLVNFQSDFKALGYVLKTCFRCRPEILEGARRVIEHNEDRVYKEMRSGREAGGKVKINGYLTADEEFTGMVETIAANNKEWAILARNNRILDSAEKYLNACDIPYKRLGGKKIWDDQVANFMLKMLWSLVRPKDTRFIGEILGWIGENEGVIQMVGTFLKMQRSSFANFMRPTSLVWSNNTETLHENWLNWSGDTKNIAEIKERMDSIVNFLYSVRGNTGRGAKIIGIVSDILINLKTDGGFVERVEILAKNLAPKKSSVAGETEQGVVTLSSLHSSKGLQWSQVWIAGANQGVCPSKMSLEGEGSGGVSEERRLFYVGMTRAVDELHMSFCFQPMVNEGVRNKAPSQFLTEGFPEEMSFLMGDLKKENEEMFNAGEAA